MANDLKRPDPGGAAPEWVNKLLDIQSKELQERAEERKLRSQSDQNGFEIAKLSLGAQERTLLADNDASKSRRRDTYILSAFVVLVIAGIIGAAMWLGKDALAMEIIKAIVFLGAGGAGGYAYGRKKQADQDGDED